ncbi:MAG: hypothetical protein QW525_03110 [Thermoplasmatales archaeon]
MLEEAYYKGKNEFIAELRDLEKCGIFLKIGIKTLFKVDYFAWYLGEKNNEIVRPICKILINLIYYEAVTVKQTRESVKDLFKRLY